MNDIQNSYSLRVILDLLGLLMIFFAPWYFSCLVILIGAIFFNKYLEAIVFGMMLDVLVGFGGHNFFFFSTIAVVLSSLARTRTSIYRRVK